MNATPASILLVALFFFAIPTLAAIPQGERHALIALYNSMNGASWVDNSGWLGAAGSECSWFGVTCDTTGSNVTEINLPSNGLQGPLPAEIGQLPRLETLNLLDATLSGTVPSTFANLGQLDFLDLGNNRFEPGDLTGDLSFLLQLKALEFVQLTGNDPHRPDSA